MKDPAGSYKLPDPAMMGDPPTTTKLGEPAPFPPVGELIPPLASVKDSQTYTSAVAAVAVAKVKARVQYFMSVSKISLFSVT